MDHVAPLVLWPSYPERDGCKDGMSPGYQLERGILYVGAGIVANPLWMTMLLWIVIVFARMPRAAWQTLRSCDLLLISVPVIYVGFTAAVGGDWMPTWRFLAPLAPLMAVAAVVSYWRLARVAPIRPQRLQIAAFLLAA